MLLQNQQKIQADALIAQQQQFTVQNQILQSLAQVIANIRADPQQGSSSGASSGQPAAPTPPAPNPAPGVMDELFGRQEVEKQFISDKHKKALNKEAGKLKKRLQQ